MLERRAITFALVVVAHVLAVLALLTARRFETTAKNEPFTTVVFFIPPTPQAQPAPNIASSPARAHPPPAQYEIPPASGSITLPDEFSTPPAVDWRSEASRAATDTLRDNDESARQRAALNQRKGTPLEETTRVPTPGITWDVAHTKRIEPLEGGGTLIHLNERCVLVVPFPLPICKVGKIAVRGDLFDHMNEPPPDLNRSSTP